ncbi:putative emerin [Scophthalmus maximus]|uniref:Putative emerin n=1 Tax=Scophthalmus maximus TaxID=52904 RepID=A0A2U9BXY6_SCOMX|nr:putative emerin [Scophthalmus maximus]
MNRTRSTSDILRNPRGRAASSDVHNQCRGSRLLLGPFCPASSKLRASATVSAKNCFIVFSEMSLSEKSDEEISKLLAEYGIKHGPIVGSTRKLYEKKLENAMEKTPAKSSSDKTYYREEEEEITYITYHSPVRHEGSADMLKRRGNAEQDDNEESDQDTEPAIQMTNRTANHSAVRYKEPVRKSGGIMWKVIRLLLLAVLAAVLYYAYCRMISDEENPFGIQ